MPVATSSTTVAVRYPPAKDAFDDADEQESYQLLELPAEILKAIESGAHDYLPLTIKGRPTDDAVLCTPTATYQVRTISVSNSFVVLRAPVASASASTDISTLEIRDTCKEILECTPIAPRLERIRKVLHGSRWEGLGERPVKRKRYTKAQLESTVQASEAQLEVGLRERNVIEVNGKLLYLEPTSLYPLLSIILSLLTVHQTSKSLTDAVAVATAPSEAILQSLEDDHGVSRDVSAGVLRLFGDVLVENDDEVWRCDLRRTVKEVGIGLLHALGHKQQPSNLFLNDWKENVGDAWEDLVDLKALEGNYLLTPVPISFTTTASSPIISAFFVHTLSTDPATRFGDLFLTRSKWRPDDMKPFLRGLTPDGDQKGMDRMIVKFVRVVKESAKEGGGVWWHPRRSI